MKLQFLNDAESLEWARDVHGLPHDCLSFVILGNEDSPDQIEGYEWAEPLITDIPIWTLYPSGDWDRAPKR